MIVGAEQDIYCLELFANIITTILKAILKIMVDDQMMSNIVNDADIHLF